MRTRIAIALVVGIVGASSAASAQSRYYNPSGSSAAASASARSRTPALSRSADASGRGTTSPLNRGAIRSNTTNSRSTAGVARTTLSRMPARSRMGIMAPVMSASDARFMSRSITRMLSARPGSVAAPRGATRESMDRLLRGAWGKMMTGGRDVRMVESVEPRGTRQTYWVNMRQPTGRVTYPPNVRGAPSGARGIPREFQHVVIQYWSSQRGVPQVRIFEAGGPPPADSRPVPRRVY